MLQVSGPTLIAYVEENLFLERKTVLCHPNRGWTKDLFNHYMNRILTYVLSPEAISHFMSTSLYISLHYLVGFNLFFLVLTSVSGEIEPVGCIYVYTFSYTNVCIIHICNNICGESLL